jgi:flagella basal body P-ring formation protein FlgA
MVRRLSKTACAVAASALALLASRPVAADELTVPTPAIVIYPGDVIRDNILVDHEVSLTPMFATSVVTNRAALIGKVARRTLLPGRPIPLIGVADPKVIQNGSQVKVVFAEDGMVITTYATALQAGGVGDIIKLRNPESGLILSGIIQADGTVRIGDS